MISHLYIQASKSAHVTYNAHVCCGAALEMKSDVCLDKIMAPLYQGQVSTASEGHCAYSFTWSHGFPTCLLRLSRSSESDLFQQSCYFSAWEFFGRELESHNSDKKHKLVQCQWTVKSKAVASKWPFFSSYLLKQIMLSGMLKGEYCNFKDFFCNIFSVDQVRPPHGAVVFTKEMITFFACYQYIEITPF